MRPLPFISCLVLLVGLMLPAAARTSETAKFRVYFSPNKLGGNTTVLVNFSIATSTGQIPSPLTDVNLRLPSGVSLGSSTLGLATCTVGQLKASGLVGCSPNALMGFGNAMVEVPFGPVIVAEPVTIHIFMGQAVNGHTSLLFYADAKMPVYAHLVFPGELLEGTSGNFAVVQMHSSLGPEHLLYSRQSNGRTVHFRPIGIAIPSHCPAGGFRFDAVLTFQDGSTITASTSVPCPQAAGKQRPAGK
jgi:hypothetical protein